MKKAKPKAGTARAAAPPRAGAPGTAALSRTGSKRKPAKRRSTAPAKAAGKSRPKQRFVVSHHREQDFRTDGLREYAKYRDLGIADATGGMVQAHVIRFVPPFRSEEVSKRHFHDVAFQMVYVLKGWIKTQMENNEPIVMNAGSSWIQPPRIEHVVLGYSDDCEVLEVILPAQFETVTLE